MKSKKKLLLLGVGAMGALAMGVGATSTFAWYQIGATGSLNNKASNSNFSVAKNTPDSMAFDFDLTITPSVQSHAGSASDTAITDSMEMTTVLAEAPAGVEGTNTSADNFYFGYYPAGSASPHMRYEQIGVSTDYWRLIKVDVRLDTSNLHGYTEPEAIALLDEATTNNGYTFNVTTRTYKKTSDVALNGQKTYYKIQAGSWAAVANPDVAEIGTYFEREATSRALIAAGTSETAKPTAAYSVSELDLEGSAILPVNGGKSYYFGLYVDGARGNDGSADIGSEIVFTATKGNVA